MKTSVIEVHDMLSVLSVDEVEKRIGDVPGVESATVNFAAGNVTVRYDETRLEPADIKSTVRQSGYKSDSHEAVGSDNHEEHSKSGAQPKSTSPAMQKTPPIEPPSGGKPSPSTAQPDKPTSPDTAASTVPKPSSGVPGAPKPSPDSKPADPMVGEKKDKS